MRTPCKPATPPPPDTAHASEMIGLLAMTAPRTTRLGLAVALLVLVADQAVKQWIVGTVMDPPRVIEVTTFFNLVMAWNRGVSFGLFYHEADIVRWILVAVALAITGFLVHWLWRAERRLVAVGLGMAIGGAIGNVIDRIRWGAVADFLDFHVAGYHWPAFNVADAGIVIGVMLLVYDSLLGHGSR